MYISSDTLQVDSNGIAPGSIFIRQSGIQVTAEQYSIDYVKGFLISSSLRGGLEIEYQTLPEIFNRQYFHKDPSLIDNSPGVVMNPFAFVPKNQNADVLSLGNLSKSGSISRGIQVGNNQDLSIQSSLNLQLSGKLGDDVDVIAAISDDNIPIQPEGNTQQIQDFDKVYIQVKNNANLLTAGDFELRRPDSYFMNYFKKSKGGYFTTSTAIGDLAKMQFGVAGAVAKGKYARQSLLGQEGNQGPYRLRGDNNEQFIIVLSGTERIYLDGLLLKRGEDEDYTIDYNTAEITFTAKRLINQYSRIVIEFEYSDKNYSRSLFYANNEYEFQKTKLRVNFYSEQDAKNQPLLQDLDNDQKLFLSQLGDNIQEAFYPNIDSVGFSPNEIRYKKNDSLGFTIYVYSIHPDSAHYRLGFTEVGVGNGNYVQINSTANGRVFQWVAPVNGIPQGNFEPIRLLIAPIKKQLLTFAVDRQLSKSFKLSFEGAYSDHDLNLYADKGNGDNKGLASRTRIDHSKRLRNDSLIQISLHSNVSLEFVDKNFRALEAYRPVEFNRNYNLQNTAATGDEYLISAGTALERNGKNLLAYQLNSFLKDTLYTGIQHNVSSDISYKKFNSIAYASLLNSEDLIAKSVYLKHKIDLNREWQYFKLGFFEEAEDNRMKASDSLVATSFAFQQYQIYVENPQAWRNTYRLDYTLRDDQLPDADRMIQHSHSEQINLQSTILTNARSTLGLGATYRSLKILSNKTNQQNEESLISRANYNFSTRKGFITSNTYYEIGSGQEPRREFTYVQVPAGQGVYVHVDYNNNGIKELNEFEIAKFQYEAEYIRVYQVSTNFVRNKSTSFTEVLNINPERIWSGKKGILKTLSLFSNQTAFKTDRKVLHTQRTFFISPFDLNTTDTALITLNSTIRNTFYFKRSDPVFGADYTVQQNQHKAFLSSGFDTRTNSEHLLRFRWNFTQQFALSNELKSGNNQYNSEFLLSKNFDIDYYVINPEFSVQYNHALRISILYGYKIQENTTGNLAEQAQNSSFSGTVNYNRGGKGSASVKVSYIRNTYTAEPNTPIAYEMLEGLQVGNNYTWNAGIQRNLGQNFQLNFIYDGRKSEGAKTIHAGSVQARAYF